MKLKKRGANYLGVCPFHNEKTPSFTVSPTKEIYKCFGCGKSGTAIGFLMDLEKYSYVEALRWLAAKYNITLEETETSPEYKEQQQKADSLFIINNFAKQFFAEQLFETEEGNEIALDYLKERGFREDIIKKFEIGYSPQSKDAFSRVALDAKYNTELLVKSGLVVMRDENLQDNYRGRVIFPVHNQTGKVIGFGARLIRNNDKAPKYINTPENELYIKSKILYGSYFARLAIDKADECLLVEGYTDVVSLHQAGIENVVASGGTSLTSDQLRLIRKYTHNLTIIYDGDSAGVKAALRGLDLALDESLNVKLVLIPDKEDPDSYVRKIGTEAFRKFIADNKQDFVLFKLSLALEEAGNDRSKKAQIVNQVADTISRINKTEEFTRRQDYIKQVADMLHIEESGLNDLVNKLIRERVNKEFGRMPEVSGPEEPLTKEQEEDASMQALFSKDELNERALVRALIEFGLKPWNDTQPVAQYIFDELLESDLISMLDNSHFLEIINLYRKWFDANEEPSMQKFLYHDDVEISKTVVDMMAVHYELSPKWKEKYEMTTEELDEIYRKEVKSTLTYLKLRKVKKMVLQNLQDMEKAVDMEEKMILLQTQQALKQMEMELTREVGTVIFK